MLLFATGLSFTLWTSSANSTLQLGAPDHLRGRVAGLYYFAFNGTGPAAGILAGWLAAKGGTELAFVVSGVDRDGDCRLGGGATAAGRPPGRAARPCASAAPAPAGASTARRRPR